MHKKLKFAYNPADNVKTFHFDHVHIFSNEQLTLHQQPTWELSYVITGQGMRIVGYTMERFSQGEVVLVPPNMQHYWAYDELVSDNEGKIENITLTFTDSLLKNIKTTFPELTDGISKIRGYDKALLFNGYSHERLQKIMQKAITQPHTEQIPSILEILLVISTQEKAYEVGRSVVENKATKRLQRVYLYVMNNYNNMLTLDKVAAHAVMEKSAFCVFFKKMTGKTFFTFFAEYRIELACDILLKTDKSIAEICFESGFGDVPYFNRTFKKIKGITPNEYRKMMR